MTDYKPYIDKFGLVQPEKESTSENGVRFSTEALLGSKDFIFQKQLYEAILSCEQKPGLMQRYPGCLKQDSFDNYTAALCASFQMDNGALARRIWNYGKTHLGFFCNNDFAFNALLWRNPSLVAFNYICAFREIPDWVETILKRSLMLAARDDQQDSKILSWFHIRVLTGLRPSAHILDVIESWELYLRLKYPRGIGSVLGKYYNPEHYNHPNSVSLMDVFK